MNKIFSTVVLALALVGSAFAQKFSTPVFSADFNGAVEVSSLDNPTNTNITYTSYANGILESVTVRTVNHDIPVDITSSQFYRSTVPAPSVLIDTFNSDGTYQGHPYSYGYFKLAVGGEAALRRERFIIVNSRTVIFIQMLVSQERNDSMPATETGALVAWQDFENSLVIK